EPPQAAGGHPDAWGSGRLRGRIVGVAEGRRSARRHFASRRRPFANRRPNEQPLTRSGMPHAQDFDVFMKRREAAALAYVQGDPGPVVDLTVRKDPASFFGPDGSKTEGVEAVLRDYRDGASRFGPDSACHFEVLHKQASDEEAFWTGFQI